MTQEEINKRIEFIVNNNLTKHQVARNHKLKNGPAVRWMQENENDTKLAILRHDFYNGIPTMARTLNDWEYGIACLAGMPNYGKSSIMVNMMQGALRAHKDIMIFDWSMDDDYTKRRQQHIACLTKLTYQQISTDCGLSKGSHQLLTDADELIETYIREDRLRIISSSEIVLDEKGVQRTYNMRTFSNLWNSMKEARLFYPDRKIYFFLDAWNDMKFESDRNTSELATVNELLAETKQKSLDYEIGLFVSAHLRKGNGGRPTIQDIKGTSDMAYIASWAGILNNSWKENAGNDPLLYQDGGNKLPIITIDVVKNKVSTWDIPLIYALDSGSCRIQPLTQDEYEMYLKMYRVRGKKVIK